MSSRSKKLLVSVLIVAAVFCLSIGVWLLPRLRYADDSSLAPKSASGPPLEEVSSDARRRDDAAPAAGAPGPSERVSRQENSSKPSMSKNDSPGGPRDLSADDSSTTDTPTAAEPPAAGSVRILMRWKETREPAPRITVLLYEGEKPRGEPCSADTDREGVAEIRYPAGWTQAFVAISKPYCYTRPRTIPLPTDRVWKLDVERTCAAHGVVVRREEEGGEKPVAGALVIASTGKSVQKTFSVEDGTWALDQISGDQVSLSAVHEGFCARNQGKISLLPGRQNGPFVLCLDAPAQTLTGAVRRAQDMTPIAGACVGIDDLDIQQATDAEGMFLMESLPEGNYAVCASASNYADSTVRVALKEGEDSTALFYLKPGGNIHIRAVDRDGAPVERGLLHVSSSDETIGGGGKRTNADGWVHLERVPTDLQYSISIWKNGQSWRSAPVQFARGQTDLEVTIKCDFSQAEIEESGPLAVFVGRVTDEADRPIAGATVLLRLNWMPYAAPHDGRRTKTGPDGTYRSEVDPATATPEEMDAVAASYEVSAYAEGWGTQWKKGQKAGTSDAPARVDFQLRPERTLLGTVSDSEGNPLGGVRVVASPPEDPGYGIAGQPETYTRADGTFWIRGLDGEKVHVTLKKTGWSRVGGAEVPTDRETCLTMIRNCAVIRGRVVDAESGRTVPDFTFTVYHGGAEYSRQRRFAEDGRFFVEGLAEGKNYEIRIESPHYETLRSNAKAEPAESGEEIVFAMTKQKILDGVVVDAATGQPISGAAVLSGSSEEGMNWIDWTSGGYGRDWTTVQTGADGRFSIADSAGNSLIAARADGYAPLAIVPYARAQYTPSGSAGLRIPLGQGATLTCSYVLDGQPQVNRRMVLQSQNERGNIVLQTIGQKNTDAAGTVVWEHLPPGLATVVCYPDSPGPDPVMGDHKTIRLSEGDSKRIDFGEFPGSGTVSGSLLQDGTPQPNLMIEFQPVSGPDPGTRFAKSDSQGRYRIVGLVPGAYQVAVLYVETSGGAQRAITHHGAKNSPVNVAAGENQIDIQVSLPATPTPSPSGP